MSETNIKDTPTEMSTLIKDIEIKISGALNSTETFQDKIKILEETQEMIKEIKESGDQAENEEALKTESRIFGLIIGETMGYLRQLKKQVDHHKSYAEEFPFPTSVTIYDNKRKEISCLEKCLADLPKAKCVLERIKSINQQIEETLKILKRRGEFNNNIWSSFQHLEDIQNDLEALTKISSYQKKSFIENCAKIRSEILNTDSHHFRLCSMKKKVLVKLHEIENATYPEEVRERIKKFNKLELDLVDYCNVIDASTLSKLPDLKLGTNDPKEFLQKLNNKCISKMAEIEKMRKLLDKEQLTDLNKLDEYKAKIETMPLCSKKVEVLTKVRDVEKRIKNKTIETKFENYKKQFQELQETIDTLKLEEKLDLIFSLKESIEDLPEENLQELNSEKQQILTKLLNYLKDLDETVYDLVVGKKNAENILDLQNNFKNDVSSRMYMRKESTDFIDFIREEAEKFARCIKCYLGTNSSLDYYIIEENLTRLIEELDSMLCKDLDMKTKIIETANYIKELIRQLEANTGV